MAIGPLGHAYTQRELELSRDLATALWALSIALLAFLLAWSTPGGTP